VETLAEGTVLHLPIVNAQPGIEWFWRYGSVVERNGVKQVFIGGALIGWFDPEDRDRGPRNVLLVTLAKEPTMHFGHLARAFGVGEEYLRRLRRLEERRGLAAVLKPAMGCAKRDLGPEKRRELRKLFAAGWNAAEATRRQRRGKRVSRSTVQRERRRWETEQQSEAIATPVAAAIAAVTGEQLDLFSPVDSTPALAVSGSATPLDEASASAPSESTMPTPASDELDAIEAKVPDEAPSDGGSDPDENAAGEDRGAVVPLRSRPVIGGRVLQHVGTWIMMSLAQRDGLHDEASKLGGGSDSSRVAIDAALASLAIGEGTVEGVRRLATPTAPQLLRADHAPTASAVRRRLWQLAKDHGAALMAQMGRRYVEAARADADAPAVFYVDNHLRPYTGTRSCARDGGCRIGACCPARPTTTSTTRTGGRCFASTCRPTIR
jgi:hypothetical protein